MDFDLAKQFKDACIHKTEKNVTSLELSRQLRDAGIKQDTLFYWVHIPAKKIKNIKTGAWFYRLETWKVLICFNLPKIDPVKNEIISAFTLPELIEACGDEFESLNKDERNPWMATNGRGTSGKGSSPEETVAKLLLALNKK